MKYEVDVLERYVEEFVRSRADGKVVDLGNGFKLYYLKNLIDGNYIDNNISKVYFNSSMNFQEYLKAIAFEVNLEENIKSIAHGMCRGDMIAGYNNKLWKITGAMRRENRGVGESERESSFEGGSEGFIEEINININLVEQYYHSPSLVTENFSVGYVSDNTVTMLYDSAYADLAIVRNAADRLLKVDAPVVQSLNGLQQLMWNKQVLIPRMLVTQRPDRVTEYLSKGKIVLFLNGTATALILPVGFHDFLKTVDDEYLLPVPALFLIILRYMALIFSIMLPSTYIAIASYNPEVLRVQLALSISSSRSGVPYPSFVEVLFMLTMMEFLVESSLRLPKSIGQTATTVGGLILGQAATQAHLVSNIMIIIIAAVAISNFMIPAISMNLTVRVMKYGLVILVSFTGIFGIYVGLYCITLYLFSIYTFDTPYFDPVGSFNLEKIKGFFRKGQ